MSYYRIYNRISQGFDYVVPSQTYVDLLSEKPLTISVVIGDQYTAEEILDKNRKAYLEQERYRFHVNKITPFRNREYIESCDLDNESDNDTVIYSIYNVMSNEDIQAVGKAAALAQLKISQDQFLENVYLDQCQKLTFIPID